MKINENMLTLLTDAVIRKTQNSYFYFSKNFIREEDVRISVLYFMLH